MDIDKKKRAAAIAAVAAYIKSEEEMCAAADIERGEGMGAVMGGSTTFAKINVWGMNGRQYQMQVRNLMQLRAFQGGRLR